MTKEVTLNEVHDLVLHVVNHMATKEDIAALRTEMADGFTEVREELATKLEEGLNSVRVEMSAGFGSIRTELSEIKQQLQELETKVKDQSGFAKEIDYAFARIAAIERHLGMEAPVAA